MLLEVQKTKFHKYENVKNNAFGESVVSRAREESCYVFLSLGSDRTSKRNVIYLPKR